MTQPTGVRYMEAPRSPRPNVPYAEVIGEPVDHSKSPTIHKFWLAKLGMEGEYLATNIGAGYLSGYLAARRREPLWRGCSVTMPLKGEACWAVDLIDQLAHASGATNCVARLGEELVGRNTDVIGFAAALAPVLDPWLKAGLGESVRLSAHVVGAGGAARGAALALDRFYPTLPMSFFNRDARKAQALSGEFRGHDGNGFTLPELHGHRPRGGDPREVILLVNATPMGMRGYPALPVNLATYSEDTIVYDMVYAPVDTPLLVSARELGMKTVSGIDMLLGQAAPAFEYFFGVPPPREHDAELRELLSR